MAKLIDADLLLQWIEKAEAYNMGRISCGNKPKGLTPEGVRHMVDTMPKVDAVEVVRCKACEYYKQQEKRCDHPSQDCYDCYDCWLEMEPDDFCSYGERREGE